jgi:hypothetical protein
MNNLNILFNKFCDNILKCKKIIDTIKIIEKFPNNIYNFKYNIVFKYIETYKKNIETGLFIDKKIVNYINNNLIFKVIYEYKYYDIKIIINIVCDKKQLQTVNNKYKKLILRIIMFIELIKDKFNINKDLIINIYLTEFKKELNDCLFKDKNIILSAKNVNSGFTDGRSITIYRNEENLKVLIHELIHYYNIDIINRDIICNKCKKQFNIDKKTKIILNEGFVETWANILNLLYIIFENYFNSSYNLLYRTIIEKKNILNKFIIFLKEEIKFCINITAKILLNYKFNSFDDFLTNKNNGLKQKTSVFSYYIAKTLFIYNIEKFLNFYFDKTKNKGIFLNNYKKENLIDLLISSSNDKNFKKKINIEMKKIKKSKSCNMSLRMTFNKSSNL